MSALMPTIVPITEAKAKLAFLVTLSETEDVVLTRHGRAAAVLVSVERYAQMLDQIEDLEDSLSAYETAGEPVVSEGQAYAELGLTSMMTDDDFPTISNDEAGISPDMVDRLVETAHRMAGRPSLTAQGGQSPRINLRLSQALKDKLTEAAKAQNKREPYSVIQRLSMAPQRFPL